MNARELLELYAVYSPSEEASEPNVHRGEYDAEGIRNIMMSYFMHRDIKSVFDALREYIDKMPDEWVIEFLRHQGDTVVEPVKIKENYELPENEWYYNHEKVYYDLTYSTPTKETYVIYATQGEDGIEFGFDFNDQEYNQLPYKVKQKLPWKNGFKSEKECIDALVQWFKAVKKDQGIKLNGMKISKPYYEG